MSYLSQPMLLKFKPTTPHHHLHYFRRRKPNLRLIATTLITLAYSAAIVCTIQQASHGQLAEAAAFSPTSAAQMASDVIAIKEGADLDLSCPIVVQNEDMIISWTCDNEPANIKSSRIHVTESGKLRIRSAKVGDSCNYRCEAADGFGTLSMLIKVIIVDKNLMEKLYRGKSTLSVGAVTSPGALANQTLAPGNSNQQAVAATRWRPAAQATLAAPAASGGHVSELSTSQTKATSTVNEGIINDQTNHLRAHKLGSISANLAAPEAARGSGGSEQADDLQVKVDPMYTYVQVNKTFSLECQVKYGHLRVPQIIWLKEFIGRQPESLNDAHDQNLILIDNIYYHSLNWPRSLFYSKETSSANSALLIRQAKQVHAGRYICLAGYQPSLMLNSASLSWLKVNNNDNRASLVSSSAQKAPLKYKMDMAIVEIDAQVGPSERDIRQNNASSSIHEVPNGYATTGGVPDMGWPSGNLLISIFSSNSLTRNLTLLIILLIGLLLLLKLVVYPYYKLSRTTNNKANNNNNTTASPSSNKQTSILVAQLQRPQDDTALTAIKTTGASIYGNSLQAAPLPELPLKQLHLEEKAVVKASQENEADQAASGSAIKQTTGNLQTDNQCNKQHQRQRWPNDNQCKNDDDADDDDKHLYSEIGERDNKPPNFQLSAEEAVNECDATSSESNNIYKVPNKLISKIN